MALTHDERLAILDLAKNLSGITYLQPESQEMFIRKVSKRISETQSNSLKSYLSFVLREKAEFELLLSSLTIHTTSWFREKPHFLSLEKYLEDYPNVTNKIIYLWSAACSTGEEVYSLALLMWKLKEQKKIFDFKIVGTDIDPLSIEKCKKGLYHKSDLTLIEKQFHSYLLAGEVSGTQYITPIQEIHNRCSFSTVNLLGSIEDIFSNKKINNFDFIFCRNVLIYFSKVEQEKVIKTLISILKDRGVLFLGHSDSFSKVDNLEVVGNAMYKKKQTNFTIDESTSSHFKSFNKNMMSKPKILIVDDSTVIRKKIRKILENHFEVSEAESAEAADLKISNDIFDLVALDLNLPQKNGCVWLEEKRKSGFLTPVMIVSESSPSEALEIFGYLENGAQEYFTKMELQNHPENLLEISLALCSRKINKDINSIKGNFSESSTKGSIKLFPFKLKDHKPKVILIGASTGGPEALSKLLKNLPKNIPPIVVVQHISMAFSKPLSLRMSQISGLREGIEENSDSKKTQENILLEDGFLYFAKGDYHLEIGRNGEGLVLNKESGDKVFGHRPSIESLFNSAANLGVETISILLTGMGQDGSLGLLKLAQTGKSFTMAQSEASCVVYGMPKKAIEAGAACFIGSIHEIRSEMVKRAQ